MIKLTFIAGLILAVMSCNNTTKTTVSVHVERAQPDAKVLVETKDSTYSTALDSTGSAIAVLAENVQPGYASVNYGRVRIPVYIEPGKSFDLALKIDGRQVIPSFTGEGAKKNEYLNGKSLKSFYPDFKADENDFIASLEEQEKVLNAGLDSMGFDSQFNQLEKKRIHYMLYAYLPMYSSYHPYYAQDKEYKPSEHYYDVLKAAIVEEEALMGMSEYKDALSGLISINASKDMVSYDPLVSVKNQLDYIQNNIKSPVVAEHFVDEYVTAYVGRSGVDHLSEIAPVYHAKVTSADKKAKLQELCDKWAKIAKGQPSPEFKYQDINGKEVSLADLAGKYVYIDVWATWCGPCRGELPHLQKLEHQFKNNNISFVSLSCDQDKAAWEKVVKEEKLGGIQLHSGGDGAFMDAYMIRGIPRFILLDREGKILAADMTRPSNAKTVETLNALEGI